MQWTRSSNPITEYWKRITDGTIRVSKKVRAVYEHVIFNLSHPDIYHFDCQRAERAVEWIEQFCHPSKGKAAKHPLRLMLWQKAMLCAIFGFVDDNGLRQYKEALLVVGRKNGKSTFASAIGLYMLFADHEAGPEIYSAATRRDQAKVIWSESSKMIHKSPVLRKYARPLVGEIKVDRNDGVFRPLSRDSSSLDGLNVSCALLDEIHAWQDQNLYDVIRDGTSAREQPLILITTTAGMVRDAVYDRKYDEAEKIISGYQDGGYVDERTLPIVYELDSKEEMWNEKDWQKANPSLGVTKDIQDLREKVYKAKHDPLQRKNLLCKDFDVIQSSTTMFFEMEDLNGDEFDLDALKPDYYIGGFDLSRVMDLTAAVALFKVPDDETLYVLPMFWMPEDTLEEHKHDNVPYDIWIDKGYIRLCPGNVIDDNMVVEWFRELREEHDMYMFRCGFDRYSATHCQQEMARNFGEKVLVPVAQGAVTLSVPMETSRALLREKKINYGANPVMDWCLLNTEAKMDVNGNIQPMKDRSLNKRIDGYAAMLDALTVYLKDTEAYNNKVG